MSTSMHVFRMSFDYALDQCGFFVLIYELKSAPKIKFLLTKSTSWLNQVTWFNWKFVKILRLNVFVSFSNNFQIYLKQINVLINFENQIKRPKKILLRTENEPKIVSSQKFDSKKLQCQIRIDFERKLNFKKSNL